MSAANHAQAEPYYCIGCRTRWAESEAVPCLYCSECGETFTGDVHGGEGEMEGSKYGGSYAAADDLGACPFCGHDHLEGGMACPHCCCGGPDVGPAHTFMGQGDDEEGSDE